MPTYSKIPQNIKKLHTTASGRYVVFTKGGLLEAGEVFVRLEEAEKRKTIPLVGYVTIKGKKYYYCAYGLFNDPDIYTKE